MSIRLTKPWIELHDLDAEELPAQLGVFQLADAAGNIVFIGYGGATRAFGLRTAITEALVEAEMATAVRYEVTHGYLSRWEELLMVHQHDQGRLPLANDPKDAPRGRLTPIAGAATDSVPS